MGSKKLKNKYYFSVEGQTEKWYLEHLQSLINSYEEINCKVSFDCVVENNPLKRIK